MSLNPLFSIIIPTFNRAQFIKRAIDSVLAQSYSNWELLVVDDGSTDNTRDVVMQYCNADKRIKYIYQQNQRVSAARNRGMEACNGDYLCFLDSDDEYKTTHLQVFADAINNGHHSNLLYTKFISVAEGIEKTFEPNVFANSNDDKRTRILNVFLPYSPPVQTICVPASVKNSVKYNPKYNYTECYDFCAKCASLAKPYFVNEATVYMHIHNGNISVANNNQQALNFYSMQIKEFTDMVNDGYYNEIAHTPQYATKLQSLYLNVIKILFGIKQYKNAIQYFAALIKWKPGLLLSKQMPVLIYQLIKQ